MADKVLTEAQIEEIRELLLCEKDRIESILIGMDGEKEGFLGMELNDEADFAAASRDYNNDLNITSQQRKELEMIDHALEKIKKGTFTGLCEMCGAEVTMQRYRIKPYARYCIDCRTYLDEHEQTA
jgi:DnaK suppressor protein